MRYSAARAVAFFAVLLTLSGCGRKVRPVDYRLPGLVAGPVDRGSVKDGRKDFAALFRGTLAHMINEGESWGDYRKYIELDTDVPASEPQLKPVRLLVAGGIFGECLDASGATPFLDAKKHFDAHHPGVTLEHVSVSALGTSANNAKQIRQYVADHPGARFVAVGHSKGAADWMEAIAAYKDVSDQVIALVTVASPVGGSRLPDFFGKDFISWVQDVLRDVGFKNCTVADAGGFISLTRVDRQQFLSTYPVGIVPAYSVVAVATDGTQPDGSDRTISKILEGLWKSLRAYSLDQDSQVIADDAIVPGGTFLAIARGDHWAVAIPFAETTDPDARRRALAVVDRNTYPRVALLEAILKTVNP